MDSQSFPKEVYIALDGQDFLEGQLTLTKHRSDLKVTYSVEINLLQKESQKIYCHVGMSHGHLEELDAREMGVHLLANFLSQKKNKH